MAKYRKYKLSWKPSPSDQVVGYKLYWSERPDIDYNSNAIDIGNINEVYLPECLGNIRSASPRFILGITAVNANGNESDIITLSEPYRYAVPPAPATFSLSPLDEFARLPEKENPKKLLEDGMQPLQDNNLFKADPPQDLNQPGQKIKYYDDVGYRKIKVD